MRLGIRSNLRVLFRLEPTSHRWAWIETNCEWMGIGSFASHSVRSDRPHMSIKSRLRTTSLMKRRLFSLLTFGIDEAEYLRFHASESNDLISLQLPPSDSYKMEFREYVIVRDDSSWQLLSNEFRSRFTSSSLSLSASFFVSFPPRSPTLRPVESWRSRRHICAYQPVAV